MYFEIKWIATHERAYLHIRSVSLAGPPRPRDGREGSVRVVKFPIICIEEEGCERFLSRKRKQRQEKGFDTSEHSGPRSFVKDDFLLSPREVGTEQGEVPTPRSPEVPDRAGLGHSHLSLCNPGGSFWCLEVSLLIHKMMSF